MARGQKNGRGGGGRSATAPQMATSGPTQEIWADQIRKATLSRRAVDEANGVHRAVLKAAKASGCNPKIVMQAVQAKKLDESTVIGEIRDYVRALNAHNIDVTAAVIFTGWQAEPRSAKAQAEADDFGFEEQGYVAGEAGAIAEDNPYKWEEDGFLLWEGGRKKGEAAAASATVSGVTKAKATRGAMPSMKDAAAGAPAATIKRGGGNRTKPRLVADNDEDSFGAPAGNA